MIRWAFVATMLAGCTANANISEKLASCQMEAEKVYPRRPDQDRDIYIRMGAASDFIETCMKAKGYKFGGDGADPACFRVQPIGATTNALCYHKPA